MGPHCYTGPCSGPDCVGGIVCTGPFCCFGVGCTNGQCIGSNCQPGSEQNEQDCKEPETASICTETVTSYTTTLPSSMVTTTTITGCNEVTACSAQDQTRTTTVTNDDYCPIIIEEEVVDDDDEPPQTSAPGGGGDGGGSTAQPGPTTTVLPPSTTAQPPPSPTPTPTKVFWIFYLHYIDQILDQKEWFFIYRPINGESWSPCDETNALRCADDDYGCDEAPEGDVEDPPMITESYTMTNGPTADCRYEAAESGPGTFSCPGFDRPVKCVDARPGAEVIECLAISSGNDFKQVVYCEYA